MNYSFLDDAWAPIEHFTPTPSVQQTNMPRPSQDIQYIDNVYHNPPNTCPFCNKKSLLREILVEINGIIENNRDLLIMILICVCIYLLFNIITK